MKKIDEGVELFDEIWEKVYSAEQQNQKEKYEMDLKKEIKKLQRLRDQVKSWIGSSDVKDKEPLVEARKLIETKMEAFKFCEKETKTKTYSKEGLAKAEKLTPEELAKQATCKWISEIIDQFENLIEERDLEVEKLSAGRGKKTNKHTIDECNHYLQMHKYHLMKLEGIVRLVNNDVLNVDVVDPIKEDLEYYLDSYDDDDYQQAYDEDFFYEALGLDELNVVEVDHVTQIANTSDKGNKKGGKGNNDDMETRSKGSDKGKAKKSKKAASSGSIMIPLTIGRANKGKAARAASLRKGGDDETSQPGTTNPLLGTPTKAGPGGIGRRSGSGGSSILNGPTPTTIPASSSVPTSVTTHAPASSMAAILKRETEQQERERQAKVRYVCSYFLIYVVFPFHYPSYFHRVLYLDFFFLFYFSMSDSRSTKAVEHLRFQQQQQAAMLLQQQQAQQLRQQQEALVRQQQEAVAAAAKQKLMQEQQAAAQTAALRQQQLEAALRQQQLQAQAQQQAAAAQQQQAVQQQAQQAGAVGTAGQQQDALKLQQQQDTSSIRSSGTSGTTGLDIIAGLNGLGLTNDSTASVGSASHKRNMSGDGGSLLSNSANTSNTNASGGNTAANNTGVLQESFATLPQSNEHDRTNIRSKSYTPQNPYPATPASYPIQPNAIFENPAIFEKLGTDALFYIFYYKQGSYQQYLAARELKKQSWRFHKKYMTWFQRHEEPKVTTDEYEQGTYVYFDWETGWCTRIKQDFRFEYSFLEDTLQ